MRTTLDLDPVVLAELKRRREVEGKPLGVIASELLQQALAAAPSGRSGFAWQRQALELRVDFGDKDALWQALDER